MKNKISLCRYNCKDVSKELILPSHNINKQNIKLIMISEAPPPKTSDYFYQSPNGSFFQTTKEAFGNAGIEIKSYSDLDKLGIYLTTAIKCRKLGYTVSAKTIKECSLQYLEKEISQFENVKIIMAMGDFAIKAVNYIYKNKYGQKVISPGSTYKIRKLEHIFNEIIFIPSYTHTGDSFNIEKSKVQMITEDIQKAFSYLK